MLRTILRFIFKPESAESAERIIRRSRLSLSAVLPSVVAGICAYGAFIQQQKGNYLFAVLAAGVAILCVYKVLTIK